MNENERIIERIKKTLNLAENAGATPAEAERAMEQANKLLAKHNLTLADIERGTKEILREEIIIEFKNAPAMRRVANAIAQVYFCEYLFFKRTDKHLFVGEQANAATTVGMVEFVLEMMIKGGKKAAKEAMLLPPSSAKTAYMHGFADAIVEKARKLIAENKAHRGDSSGAGTALVLADQYKTEKAANQALIAQKYGKTSQTKRRARRNLDYESYTNGFTDGTKVGLNTQIN
jgi:hypothetical protein